ncbi:hypothetical protein IFM89_005190 [Coptis chinensis]|uniref:Uncharacterized protein n=1 Tax=Coptis chinensis TaxID=261450 RepID=A0A835HXM5_9MAGN|nr:hypothetical protein IFM89_005190 [Coptis chinensis]
MALCFEVTPLLCSIATRSKFSLQEPRTSMGKRNDNVYAAGQAINAVVEAPVIRRSANFKPNLWDYDSIMSLTSDYTVDNLTVSYKDDEIGSLKMCLSEDVKGMLSLYEASYFGLEGEDFMDEAKAFTTRHLRDIKGNINPTLAKKVAHSLELPLHWRISRLETRWYIDTYESEDNMVALLLDLAKLDYNMVQATYQSEIKGLIRWWVDLGLCKLDFFKDRILEHYFWSLGMVPEQQFGRFRVGLAQDYANNCC